MRPLASPDAIWGKQTPRLSAVITKGDIKSLNSFLIPVCLREEDFACIQCLK
jgi:hypothetical protein